jgi:hypothetical protein
MDWELGVEITTITRLPGPDTDWRKPISEYLQLGTISDDDTETQHLVRRAKGYLIHDGELYHRSTSIILQLCFSIEEGKALLLDIDEGIYPHHALLRNMVKKAF